MALSRTLVCVVLCSLHAAAAFAPYAPAALAPTRPRASAVPVHPVAFAPKRPRASAVPVHPASFARFIAANAVRALKRTLSPATVCSLATTQAVLLLSSFTKSMLGVEVHLADLFSSQKLFLRLSVGLCSVFLNKMLNTGKIGAFVVSQIVLAAFMVCTPSELPLIFTFYTVFERACLYTTALRVPAVLKQARRVADRVGLYMRTLRMYFSAYRAFA